MPRLVPPALHFLLCLPLNQKWLDSPYELIGASTRRTLHLFVFRSSAFFLPLAPPQRSRSFICPKKGPQDRKIHSYNHADYVFLHNLRDPLFPPRSFPLFPSFFHPYRVPSAGVFVSPQGSFYPIFQIWFVIPFLTLVADCDRFPDKVAFWQIPPAPSPPSFLFFEPPCFADAPGLPCCEPATF